MNKYFTFWVYTFLVIFTYFYDLFLGNQINPISYDKRRNYMTILYLISNITWGLIIFYCNYANYNILSWVLLMIYFIPMIIVLICDAIKINLYLNFDEPPPPNHKK